MINQIVNSREQLEDLMRIELESRELSNNQHGDNTKEEMQEFIDAFFGEYNPKTYPVVAVVEFNFIYHGFDIDLNGSAHFFTPKQIADLYKVLNRKQLRHLIDVVWNHVYEDESVPSTLVADSLINKALKNENNRIK